MLKKNLKTLKHLSLLNLHCKYHCKWNKSGKQPKTQRWLPFFFSCLLNKHGLDPYPSYLVNKTVISICNTCTKELSKIHKGLFAGYNIFWFYFFFPCISELREKGHQTSPQVNFGQLRKWLSKAIMMIFDIGPHKEIFHRKKDCTNEKFK